MFHGLLFESSYAKYYLGEDEARIENKKMVYLYSIPVSKWYTLLREK